MKQYWKWTAAVLGLLAGTALTGKKAIENQAEEALGTAGRLYFSNGYSVALNEADAFAPTAQQRTVDAQDSAAMITYSSTLIADHNTQGFNIIKNYGPGSVISIEDASGQFTNYVCISYYGNCTWSDGSVILPDGRDAWFGDSVSGLRPAMKMDIPIPFHIG